MNVEAKRIPHDLTRSIHNLDDMNQLNNNAQGIMLIALLQDRGLHLAKLLL